jgi:small subunit ribosomal protein S9
MADLVQYYGTGRRKSAIARVFLRPGTGEWKVNGKAFDVYFVTEQQRVAAKRTLALVELASSFDVVTTVKSGAGRCRQAGHCPRAGPVQPRIAQGAQG